MVEHRDYCPSPQNGIVRHYAGGVTMRLVASSGCLRMGLEQEPERGERTYRKQVVLQKAAGHHRHRLDRRLGLFDRLNVHEEERAGNVLAEPKLFDLAAEIKLECVRNFLWHDLLPLFRGGLLNER